MNEIVLAIATTMEDGKDGNGKPYKGINRRKAAKEITEVAKLVGSLKTTNVFTCRLVSKDTIVARINRDLTDYLPQLSKDSLIHLCNWKHIQISFANEGGKLVVDGETLL